MRRAASESSNATSQTGRILVFIPVHNGSATLNRSLASLAQQTYQNLLVVIIDDASSDSSVGVVKRFIESRGLSWILFRNEERMGISASLDRVLSWACDQNFTHVLLFSQDDELKRDHIATRVRRLSRSSAVLITGPAVLVAEGGQVIAKLSVPPLFLVSQEWRCALLVWKNWIFGPGTLVQRECLEDSLAPPSLDRVQDWYQWCLMARYGGIAVDTENPVTYLVRSDSVSRLTTQDSYGELRRELRLSVIHRFIADSRGPADGFDYMRFRTALCRLVGLDVPSPERTELLKLLKNWSPLPRPSAEVESSPFFLGMPSNSPGTSTRPLWETRYLPSWMGAAPSRHIRISQFVWRTLVILRTTVVWRHIIWASLRAWIVGTCRGGVSS